MFGSYRIFLALAVMAHHLLSIPILGHYAVHGFFILSGYLMTLVMCSSYGYSSRGVRSFLANRCLRLYPAYIVTLILTILVIAHWGQASTSSFRQSIFLPRSLREWVQNVTFIYLNAFPSQEQPRLSPPTWTLTIEALFYLLIGIGLSKTRRRSLIWLGCSAVYMATTHFCGLGYRFRYAIVLAGSLPFALGATIYHCRARLGALLPSLSKPRSILGLSAIFILNALASARLASVGNELYKALFYVNYLINAALLIGLIGGRIPFIPKKVDQVLGDFSYPIYLLHWQAGFVASMAVWGEPALGLNLHGIVVFSFALLFCLGVSWLIRRYVEQPVQVLRGKIKRRANRTDMRNLTLHSQPCHNGEGPGNSFRFPEGVGTRSHNG